MTLHFGNIPSGSTLYIPFTSYNSAGASATISGLAVTDIEIYKNGSTTQRASDNGYSLLDTDGIDFDGITGLNGFSIDLSDNSDSGFYAVGSQYWVVVSTITVDSQTVTFLAATFRIVAAESTAGYPNVTIKAGTGTGEINLSSGVVPANVTQFGGSSGTFASGRPEVNLTHIAGSPVSTSAAQLGVNVVNFGGSSGTFSSGRPEVNTSHWGGTAVGSALVRGNLIQISGSNVNTGSAQLGVNVVNAGGTAWASGAITANSLASNAITAAKIADGAIDAATFAADVDAEILSYIVDDSTRIDASALNTLSGHDPGTTIGTSTLTQAQVTGGAYALNSASFAFNAALDLTATQKASVNSEADTAFSDGMTTPMTESYAAQGATMTPVQALYQINQHLGESSISGTTKTVKKRDGSTTAKTFTLDDDTAPTSITEAT